MLDLRIKPGNGVGPIRLGATKAEARQLLDNLGWLRLNELATLSLSNLYGQLKLVRLQVWVACLLIVFKYRLRSIFAKATKFQTVL